MILDHTLDSKDFEARPESVAAFPNKFQREIMTGNKKQNGRQILRKGTTKQVKAALEKQEELKLALQSVTVDSSEAKSYSNNKIIRIIDTTIKPLLEKRRDEHKTLSSQTGGKKEEKEARSKRLDSLKTEIEDMLVIMNLIGLLASNNPSSRKDYNKLLRKPAKIAMEGDAPYDVSFRKEALKTLRDTLQGFQGDTDLLAPALLDEVTSIMIQFRHKMCLDCMMGDYGRDETEVAVPCSICKEPLCGNCVNDIKKITQIMSKDTDIQKSKG